MYKNLQEEFKDYYDKLETNLCSFERDYKDEDGFYTFIQIGTREPNIDNLVRMGWKRLEDLTKLNGTQTPDYGGLLCVLGYNDTNLNISEFENLCFDYIDKADESNPHNLRWKISLCYLLGELTNKIQWYMGCMDYKFIGFSPIIVSKQMKAAEKVARHCLERNKKIQAERCIIEALEEFKEALRTDQDKTVGKNGTYIYFGCVELAELCDLASELVKFIQNIDLYYTNREEFEQIFSKRRWGLYAYCKELENKIESLEDYILKTREFEGC